MLEVGHHPCHQQPIVEGSTGDEIVTRRQLVSHLDVDTVRQERSEAIQEILKGGPGDGARPDIGQQPGRVTHDGILRTVRRSEPIADQSEDASDPPHRLPGPVNIVVAGIPAKCGESPIDEGQRHSLHADRDRFAGRERLGAGTIGGWRDWWWLGMRRHEFGVGMESRGDWSVGCDAGRVAGPTVAKVDDHVKIRRAHRGPLSDANRGK